MDIKTNRIRAPNFSQDEKLILISLIKKYKLIIENKRTDAVSGGSSNIVTDVVADAIYEIIGPSIDGLINPFDSDKPTPKSNDVETPSTVINLLDDDMENDDPNHTSVFQAPKNGSSGVKQFQRRNIKSYGDKNSTSKVNAEEH
ncbi:Methionyl-trna synthetase [Temnothorax longispinosus]|uniref:Regulatory protein zeste n=1 Tax=Temnothorax longispinosus TaxID=300112 RepID=A0A4V3SBC6_9HYME|nr:Methionyl-trna synthetase [Temnothorax longispinosus]